MIDFRIPADRDLVLSRLGVIYNYNKLGLAIDVSRPILAKVKSDAKIILRQIIPNNIPKGWWVYYVPMQEVWYTSFCKPYKAHYGFYFHYTDDTKCINLHRDLYPELYNLDIKWEESLIQKEN